MNIKQSIFLIYFLFALPILAQFSDLKWMIGDWIQENSNSYTIESWSHISKSTIEGISKTRSAKNDSIIFTESLRIFQMGNDIFYLAKVPENKFPIAFTKIYSDSNLVVFENETHDFPQKIAYQNISIDSMKVTISRLDDITSERNFYFKRR